MNVGTRKSLRNVRTVLSLGLTPESRSPEFQDGEGADLWTGVDSKG